MVDALAWDVYWQAQRLGFDMVYRLRRLDRLDAYDADWLVRRLVVLHDLLATQRQSMRDA